MTKPLRIRVNDDERRWFEDAARRAGMRLSVWVRMVLRNAVDECERKTG